MVYDFLDELKNIIKDSLKKFFIKFKYMLLLILFIALVLCIFLLEKEEPKSVESQQLKLLGITIENWFQWITLIGLPYTAGWAIYQFRKNNIAKKQEKAVEIEKDFSQNIINKCGIINAVFKQSSLNSLLKFDEKNYDDFKFFNVDELRSIYNDDDFPTIYNEMRQKYAQELDDIYHYILLNGVTPIVNSSKVERKIEISPNKDDKLTETNSSINKNPFILQNQNFPYHFFELESDLLNQLEYICMNISSKATDSNFIYQSLHQMFLRTVRTLAVEIAVDNKNFSDKYYTNIIHVYNIWTARYIKDSKIEKRKKEKINRILNPKIKTV